MATKKPNYVEYDPFDPSIKVKYPTYPELGPYQDVNDYDDDDSGEEAGEGDTDSNPAVSSCTVDRKQWFEKRIPDTASGRVKQTPRDAQSILGVKKYS